MPMPKLMTASQMTARRHMILRPYRSDSLPQMGEKTASVTKFMAKMMPAQRATSP